MTLSDLVKPGRVWGDLGGSNPQAVHNAVRKYRRKLGDDARKPRYVLGERGLGYRMPGPTTREGAVETRLAPFDNLLEEESFLFFR